MLSFWEKNSFLNYDYIVIGAGILGLSTACSIKEKNRNASVLIIEKGMFPEGASTKNAGFACFGSLTEILADFNRLGENETMALVEKRFKGIEMLRKRLGDKKIGFENNGGYELITEDSADYLEKIEDVNDKLNYIFDDKVFEIKNENINVFGFNDQMIKALVYSRFESQIDTGKMMNSLTEYAATLGVRILNNCEVEFIGEKENYVKVFVKHPGNDKIFLSAKNIYVCANAFTVRLLPFVKVTPGRGQVLITKPLSSLKFKGVFHFDEGYYYFRNYENRVIFGGGRNLDFEKEESTVFETNDKIISDLKMKLKEIILYKQKFEIDYTWTGIMGFTENKLPLVECISDRIVCVISCNGMGIALSSFIADEITKQVT